MRNFRWVSFLIVFIISLAACAPGVPTPRATGAGGVPDPAVPPNRTLVVAMHVEPTTVAPRPPTTSGITPGAPTFIFSGWLAVADGKNVPRAQLAEKLPTLNTSDWVVFPDGKMETTYRLRPGLMWHDGTPLTAEDVVFGYKVFTWPDMGVPTDLPIRAIEDVSATDDRTILIRWKQSYAGAGALDTTRYGALPPMPRHLLEAKFRAGDANSFLNDPYWTNQFIGSGPYRLDRWEPGAFIQATAFPGFIEGKPQIDQIKLIFMPDPSSAVASLLAGEAHVAAEEAIGFDQGAVLKNQWQSTGAGVVLLTPNKTRFLQVQFKDGYTNPRIATDLRVRRAILQGTDREGLSGAILDGEIAVAHTIAGPVEDYFAELDRVGTKYPYSVVQAERLLAEAGFVKGADGVGVDPSGQRLALELRAFTAEPGPKEAAILSSQWKAFGLDAAINIIPAAQSQNLEMVSAYPALRIEQTGFTGTTAVNKLVGSAIATQERRWAGVNRGGWLNPEYDRFIETYVSSLDRGEATRAVVQALRIASDELPAIPLYYLSLAAAHTSSLQGPAAGYNNDMAFDNVHQWRWVR